MAKKFDGKLTLITGASSGFGAATARVFAKEGSRLLLLARRMDRLNSLKEELEKAYGASVYTASVDVSNYELVQQAHSSLPKDFAVPDILINNAGLVRGLNHVWETTPQEWNEMIDTNVKGVLNMTRLFLPSMLEKKEGHIINVGSISGHQVYPGGSVYCATKFALRAISETLRAELISTNLRVSLISPGLAETEFSQVRFYGDQTKAKSPYEGVEALSPQDIAEAIEFIASRPPHVTIADLVIYPRQQASTTLIHRNK